MKIAATQFSLKYSALEIYLSGCNSPHCSGCHNPALWDFGIGHAVSFVIPKIKRFSSTPMVNWLWVLGGEPLDQDHKELAKFLTRIREVGKPIVLFTRYELDEVPDHILGKIDYVKTGRFVEGRPSVEYHGITLASDNQKVTKIINRH